VRLEAAQHVLAARHEVIVELALLGCELDLAQRLLAFWNFQNRLAVERARLRPAQQHALQHAVQFLVRLLRSRALEWLDEECAEDGEPVKRLPLQEAEVGVQVLDAVLDWRA
jgi:hypothetical protein